MNTEKVRKICKEYFPIEETVLDSLDYFVDEKKDYSPVTLELEKPYILISTLKNNEIEGTLYDFSTIDEDRLREKLEQSKDSFKDW